MYDHGCGVSDSVLGACLFLSAGARAVQVDRSATMQNAYAPKMLFREETAADYQSMHHQLLYKTYAPMFSRIHPKRANDRVILLRLLLRTWRRTGAAISPLSSGTECSHIPGSITTNICILQSSATNLLIDEVLGLISG